jgi:CheY-like chemotaxis protein
LKLVQVLDKKGCATETQVCFTVTDTGIGMSGEYVKYQLFTPFVQENSLSPGTGLGLSIVKQIVTNLRGTMDVKSEIGRGTTVKVLLPFNQDVDRPFLLQRIPIVENNPRGATRALNGRSLCYISPQAYKAMVNPNFEITSDVQDRSISLQKVLTEMANTVFGMNVQFATADSLPDSDLYFLDGHLLGNAMHGDCDFLMLKRLGLISPLVVMCSAKAGSPGLLKSEPLKGRLFVTHHPLGPRKLETALLEALKVGNVRTPTPEEPFSSSQHSRAARDVYLTRSSSVSDARRLELVSEDGLANSSEATANELSPIPGLLIEQRQFPLASASSSLPESSTLSIAQLPALTSSKPISGSPPTPTASLSSSSSPEPRTPPRQHVLLVDDNPINLKILTTIVKKMNCTYLPAFNGQEAVQIYKSATKPIDVIFMDISMPVMDGFTATREIRAFEREMKLPPCKIVALTGLGSAASRQEAFVSGTNLFLTKPVRIQEVRNLLTKDVTTSAAQTTTEKIFLQDKTAECPEPSEQDQISALREPTFPESTETTTPSKPVDYLALKTDCDPTVSRAPYQQETSLVESS